MRIVPCRQARNKNSLHPFNEQGEKGIHAISAGNICQRTADTAHHKGKKGVQYRGEQQKKAVTQIEISLYAVWHLKQPCCQKYKAIPSAAVTISFTFIVFICATPFVSAVILSAFCSFKNIQIYYKFKVQYAILRMVITMKLKTINFERTTGKALYLQIYEKLRSDILSGYLVKGDQLPSIRKCEALMKVSKTSIERAYEKLLEEGYILSIPQKGFFVDVEPENVQLRKAVLAQGAALQDEKIRYDFRSQTMDVSSFDLTLWKKYLKEVLDGHYEIATYGEARGELRLRMALQKYAYTVRGVLCTSNQLLIGSSFNRCCMCCAACWINPS